MITVTDHNTDNVYLAGPGGLGVHHPELESVTYIDDNGTHHTIHVPKALGFTDAHDIINAVHRAHELMVQERTKLEREFGTVFETHGVHLNQVFAKALTDLAPNKPEGDGEHGQPAPQDQVQVSTGQPGGAY